jgi:lipopolysaccharide exporter
MRPKHETAGRVGRVAAPGVVLADALPAPSRAGRSFARDVLTLVSGTTAAQAVTLLAAPIIARLYAPAAFGTASIFTSVASTIGVIACLRYEAAIILPRSDGEAANLLVLSLGLSVLIGLLMVPCVGLALGPASAWIAQNGLSAFVWWVPPAVFFYGASMALTFWQTRRRHFGTLSLSRVTGTGTGTGIQLVAGAGGHGGPAGLVAATIVGTAAQATLLATRTLRGESRVLWEKVRWSGLRRAFTEHRKFPLYSSWAILLNEAAWQLPTFWLASAFSATVVGFYAVGTRLLRVPMNVIGGAIGQVFYERAAKAREAGNLPHVVEVTFRGLVLLGLFPLLVLTLCGKELFVVFLGARWAEAGVYVEILSLWMFFWFLSSPLMQLINVLQKQEWGLVFNAVLLVSRAAALAVGGALHDARLALVLFGLSGVLSYGYLNGRLMAEAGFGWAASCGLLLRKGLLFLPAGASLLLAKWLGAPALATVGVALLFGLLYLAYLWKFEPEVRGLVRIGRKAPAPVAAL